MEDDHLTLFYEEPPKVPVGPTEMYYFNDRARNQSYNPLNQRVHGF